MAKRPELLATGPGQVWCWDITWLDSPTKGTYFYLYMAIDMFSRKVVAWEVYAKEDGTLARDLFAEAMKAEGILPGTLLVCHQRFKVDPPATFGIDPPPVSFFSTPVGRAVRPVKGRKR